MYKKPVYVGFVIPTYNEKENIVRLLDKIHETMKSIGIEHRIVVVDDNSPDGTAKLVAEYSRSHNFVKILVRPRKQGLGSAIATGMRDLLSDPRITHIVTMDADFSHRPEDLPVLLRRIDSADLVQGSRYVDGGKIVGWSFKRRLVSRVANTLIRVVHRTNILDHTSNYRVYSREAAERIVGSVSSSGYEWVIEALLTLLYSGYTVVEAPITFIDRVAGKSKLGLRDIAKWFIHILSLKRKLKKTR